MSLFYKTEVEHWRKNRGRTQRYMAEQMGLSLPTYKRFDRGEIKRPPLAYFVNASIILDVPLERLIDPQHLHWQSLGIEELAGDPELKHGEAEIRETEKWRSRNWLWVT